MSPPTFEPSQQKKADQECTLLAGQWVAATGQDFNILEDSLTKKFLESYKHTSKNYKLPSRKRLSGDLLDINYEVQEAASLKALKNGADLGGIQFCSDFATLVVMLVWTFWEVVPISNQLFWTLLIAMSIWPMVA